MTYREPWDTVDNADSQMARYPRNRDEERARALSSSLFINKNSHHHKGMHRFQVESKQTHLQLVFAISDAVAAPEHPGGVPLFLHLE